VLGLQERFQGTCFGHALLKVCQYPTIDEFFGKDLQCVNQNYPRRFVKMHNLAKKIRKRWARIGEGMCQFRSSLKEIEYSSEDKVTFYFF